MSSNTPQIVTDKWFRSRVRPFLAELPNSAAGLGLKVTGTENVIMIYPRFGRRIQTMEDLLAMHWYAVQVDGSDAPTFVRIETDEVNKFLEALGEVTKVWTP